ncbi:MAG: ABC transporter substrate-binding protein [Chloroflexi bacterium]|nr:ABC transporter substrate-binding protein [Chloroflexota bacterium]MBU1662724.1 ABC transporter substrate-binding protein [Chloroflexota bacterium]
MTRKLILILTILLLALTACAPKVTPTEEPIVPVKEPTEEPAAYPEPAIEPETADETELEPYPEPVEVPDTAPVPYPEPVEEPAPAPLVLTDDMGRTVELAGPAQAIVTLGPSSLESLFAIGAGAQIIGREEFSTYPEEALDITSVGSLYGELPTEIILALEPDLVIAPEIISPEQIQALEDLGLTVYFQGNPSDFEGLWANLRTLAAISGHETEADELIAGLDARVKAVTEKIMPLSYHPTVFYELDATDPQNPYTVGAGTFIDLIISMAGGTNIGAVLEGQYAPISSEEIIAQNPEIILLADAPYGITPESVAARAGWDVIAAVQNEMVYPFDPFLVSVPGPRLVDGLEAMAVLLHPNVFE